MSWPSMTPPGQAGQFGSLQGTGQGTEGETYDQNHNKYSIGI